MGPPPLSSSQPLPVSRTPGRSMFPPCTGQTPAIPSTPGPLSWLEACPRWTASPGQRCSNDPDLGLTLGGPPWASFQGESACHLLVPRAAVRGVTATVRTPLMLGPAPEGLGFVKDSDVQN